jgi:adenosylmethionine-8-amino-7-oxononanoate aminotransferase
MMRRMANVFYRNPRHHYPTGMRGDGVYLYDSGGKQYLDSSGGAAVSCLGHGHPVVIEAIKAQLDKLAYAHTAFFTNEPQEQMAGRLAERLGDDSARVYFLSGGSEANETAIKIARQYWMARGHDRKHVIISRKQSYHGNTLGALSASGNLGRRKIFAPLLHDWPKIEPCYAYRNRDAGESDEDYGERVAASLEAAILAAGPENVSAFMAETVVGATIGAVPPAPGYFARIREICDRHDVLLILDEVMAGCGRSGTYFAFEQDGVMPDMVTIAKGLGGGYQAIGAVIVQGHVHDSIVEAFGSFEHGHTYIGHATACATALAISGLIDEYDLLERVTNTGEQLRAALADAFAEHANVGDIRGRGLLLGIELVTDREAKAPAPARVAAEIKDEAMAQGLIIYPGGGTADGTNGAHILLAPPFIYEPRHVDELVSKLLAVVDAVSFEP